VLEGNHVYSPLRSVSVDYTFALLGTKNHELYFGHLGGDGGDPGHRFADVVEFAFPGGLENWHRAVRKAAAAARGWLITGHDLDDGTVFNHVLDSQNLRDMVPLLALDVYEHAYAPDFGATPDGRARYVEAFFDNLDWNHVERQVERAVACRDGSELAAARAGAGVGVRTPGRPAGG